MEEQSKDIENSERELGRSEAKNIKQQQSVDDLNCQIHSLRNDNDSLLYKLTESERENKKLQRSLVRTKVQNERRSS